VSFSEETVREAWERSQGNCECRRTTHGHPQRCNEKLDWNRRGMGDSPGSWDTHPRLSPRHGGSVSLANCEVLCSICQGNILLKSKKLFGAD
jgi:hypothetical protein